MSSSCYLLRAWKALAVINLACFTAVSFLVVFFFSRVFSFSQVHAGTSLVPRIRVVAVAASAAVVAAVVVAAVEVEVAVAVAVTAVQELVVVVVLLTHAPPIRPFLSSKVSSPVSPSVLPPLPSS